MGVKERVKKFFLFFKRHWLATLLITVALIVAGLVIWDSFSAGTANPGMGSLKPKKETKVAAPISGILVDEATTQKKVLAVVVENHPDARPQSGLNKADLVYETFAEGGITRFLALYQSQEPKEIGPVRSARPYFVDWASSYKAIFAHVGGSVDALAKIPKSNVYDLNQFYNANAFWRDNSRYAPHNVYTTMAKLYQGATARNYPTTDGNVPKLVFKKDLDEKSRPAASAFTVRFNIPFAVTWTYNPKDNFYYRTMLGVSQKDKTTGEQIKAKNVLVGFSEFGYGVNSDGVQKVDIRTTGTGAAVIFIDGARSTGTWQRTATGILRFYDAAGKEVKLNPGTTWVEFAPVGTAVN